MGLQEVLCRGVMGRVVGFVESWVGGEDEDEDDWIGEGLGK